MGELGIHKNFAVVIAPTGLKTVTDSNSLSILSSVSDKPLSLTQIAWKAGMHISTAHSILESLTNMGLLKRCKNEEDKKTVMYELMCVRIIDSKRRSTDISHVMRKVIEESRAENADEFYTMSSLFLRFANLENGIDAGTLVEIYGREISKVNENELISESPRDLIKRARPVMARFGFSTPNVVSLDPFVLSFSYNEGYTDDCRVASKAPIGMILEALDFSFGTTHTASIMEHMRDGVYTAEVTFEESKDVINTLSILKRKEWENEGDFILLSSTDDILLVDSPVQISIHNALKNGASSLKTLLDILKIPRSTLVLNLGKMSGAGVIDTVDDGSGTVCYLLTCKEILKKNNGSKPNFDLTKSILDQTPENTDMVNRFRFIPLVLELENLGIDCAGLLKQFGTRVASASFCKKYDNADAMIRKMSENSFRNNTEMVITSMVPLRIRFRNSFKHPLMANILLDFYEGELMYILNTYTGQNYAIVSTDATKSCGFVRTYLFSPIYPPYVHIDR